MPTRRGQDPALHLPGNDNATRHERRDSPAVGGVRTEGNTLSSIRNTRTSTEDVREDSGRTRSSRDEATKRSRISNQSDTEQQKHSGTRSERSSRVHQDSKAVSKDQSRIPLARDVDTQTKPVPRQETPSKPYMDSTAPSTESTQLQRSRSDGTNQGNGNIETRPRTPEGPRGNDNSQTSSPNLRVPGPRDMPPTRPMRYDAARLNNPPVRSGQGFRAPPPTGPRASTVPTMSAQSSNLNAPRTQVSGRTTAITDSHRAPTAPLGTRSTPPPERSDVASSSRTVAPGMNPERAAMMGLSSRESDATTLTRSGPTQDSRNSRNRTVSGEGPLRSLGRENLHPSDAPRGPSDWKVRAKRDIQDEDPRRLSRGPDTWGHAASESERQGRISDEIGRSGIPKPFEGQKELSSSKARPAHDKDIKEHDDASHSSLQSRGKPTRKDVSDTRRTRANVTGDGESDARSLRLSGHGAHSNNVAAPNPSEGKAETVVSGREKVESSAHNHNGKDTTTKRTPHAVTSSREQKDLSRDRKAPDHRGDDDSLRRREERDNTKSRKDESRDSGHDRPREAHHIRASARRSPSRSNSDRGEKKDRERESDRRNGSRREAREPEHRDKDRPLRELEHRRDGRDRERSSRDREPEGRRGSRKHERDRSAEALDRGARTGDVGESSITGDSLLPSKRRRVVR
jgi:hypothetical protein